MRGCAFTLYLILVSIGRLGFALGYPQTTMRRLHGREHIYTGQEIGTTIKRYNLQSHAQRRVIAKPLGSQFQVSATFVNTHRSTFRYLSQTSSGSSTTGRLF